MPLTVLNLLLSKEYQVYGQLTGRDDEWKYHIQHIPSQKYVDVILCGKTIKAKNTELILGILRYAIEDLKKQIDGE